MGASCSSKRRRKQCSSRIAGMVRQRWHAEMRRAGVSDRDCEAIGAAFLYDSLFYDNLG